MKLQELLSFLGKMDPNAPLVFTVDGVDIGGGYHVTELRHLTSTGIDCGGQIETWDEARLQLLDGSDGGHMNVEKFVAIAERSVKKLPQLSDASLQIEFAPGNAGLRIMTLEQPQEVDRVVRVDLVEQRAICKPFERLRGRRTIQPARLAKKPIGCCE